MAKPLSVAGFAGSLRAASYNRALLRAARELAPASLAVSVYDIDAIPLYDFDLERTAFPDSVTRLKQALRVADGTLIVTPEYNHSFPGVLKNVIDWISRPPGEAPALSGKPVAIMGASGGVVGTARAQQQLRAVLVNLNAAVMPQPAVQVAQAQTKFDAEGRLADDATRTHVRAFLEAFARWIALIARKAP